MSLFQPGFNMFGFCMTRVRFAIILPLLFVCFSCGSDLLSERAKKAGEADGSQKDIVIGIVASSEISDLFIEGVTLAVNTLNQSDAKVMGRKIHPVIHNDKNDPDLGLKIAEKLSADPDIVAVVGHFSSNVAIPASVTYERDGIVFISPGATEAALTEYGGILTFRNLPSDEQTGREMAELAKYKKYQRIVVMYDREAEGRRLAEIFSDKAIDLGLNIVVRKSYFSWQEDIPLLIAKIAKKYEFDAVFLSGQMPSAAKVIRQLREMGVHVPILGNELLDSPDLSIIAGNFSDGVIVPTVFDPRRSTSRTQSFIKTFKTIYGIPPDSRAAQGYDAVQVLAHAMNKCGSTVPVTVSTTLRSLENWEGVTGRYSFMLNGDITGKATLFKKMKDGEFEFIAGKPVKTTDHFDLLESVTLRLPLSDIISTIDPGLADDPVSGEITEQLFLGLTDLDPKTLTATPELAEKWEVDEDGLNWQFHLRQDVKWTDGSKVTAHDVVWAIKRNLKPETGSSSAHRLYILKNAEILHTWKTEKTPPPSDKSDKSDKPNKKDSKGNEVKITKPSPQSEIKEHKKSDKQKPTDKIEAGTKSEKPIDKPELGVRAVDDFTVAFTLEYPLSHFPVLTGFPEFRPLPKHTVEKYGETWTDLAHIQTNGSYRPVFWNKNGSMILRKNSDYFDADNVSIQEVRYYPIQQISVGMALYHGNKIDIMGGKYLPIPRSDVSRIRSDHRFNDQYSNQPRLCTDALAFNPELPPVDNPLVRQAISAAIDRNMLITAVLGNQQIPATAFTPFPAFGAQPPGDRPDSGFDADRAKILLKKAGYEDGKDCPPITLAYDQTERNARVAGAVQAFLRHHLNLTVILEEKPADNYLESIGQSDTAHMFRFSLCGEYPDADQWLFEPYHRYGLPNLSGWKDSSFFWAGEKVRASTDPNTRIKFFLRAERIMIEDTLSVIPLYFETYPCLVKSRVKGWYHMPVGGQHIRNWKLVEK